jgi:ubiquinone biosynthesis protein
MRGPHNIWRLIRTGATFERTGAMKVALDAVNAPARVRFAARVLGWPFAWLGYKGDPNLPPVTRAITALGPAYVKFGQILSTRPDVVGVELANQLTMLQDRLPPFPTETAIQTIESALGQPVDALFSEFSDPSPRPRSRRSTARAAPITGARSRSRCCAPASRARSAAISTPSISPPA